MANMPPSQPDPLGGNLRDEKEEREVPRWPSLWSAFFLATLGEGVRVGGGMCTLGVQNQGKGHMAQFLSLGHLGDTCKTLGKHS